MGLINSVFSILFGDNKNVVTDIIQTIRPNAENSAQRNFDGNSASLSQYSAEFNSK